MENTSQNQDESDTAKYNLKLIERWKKDMDDQQLTTRRRLKFAYNIYRKRGKQADPLIRELFEESIFVQMSLAELFGELWGLVDGQALQFQIKQMLENRISELEGKILKRLTTKTIKSAVQSSVDNWTKRVDNRLEESRRRRADYIN